MHGEGNGTPHQYFCLENPMDGGAWWAAIYGVARSRTRLKRLSSSSSSSSMYTHGWIPSVFIWNYHNIVNRLHAALRLVTQSRLTLCDPIDCSPPGSSVHGDSPDKDTGVGCHSLLQGSNPGLSHYRQIIYCLSHHRLYLKTNFFKNLLKRSIALFLKKLPGKYGGFNIFLFSKSFY